MTKFDYEILLLLNEKNVDNPLKAINGELKEAYRKILKKVNGKEGVK